MNYQFLGNVNHHDEICKLSQDELSILASEIRDLITKSVSNSGGHLASNLGVTELTIALHRVFNFEQDRLVWDVGHQCYVHKMLTGRSHMFDLLRQAGGVSGFPSPSESKTDQFAVGHAGTAIPSAVGLALGAQLQNSPENIVAVVGDASIVNGLAFEGLNNTPLIKRQMLIIFNDNSMGISKTEGAFAQYLTKLRVSRPVEDLHRTTEMMVRRFPYVGKRIHDTMERIKGGIKTTLHGWHGFEQLGLPYFGPIDGHDTATMIKLFEAFKHIDHPVILHVLTEKGRGFEPATQDPCTFHSPAAFRVDGDTATIPGSSGKSFTHAFADAMCKLMEKDKRVVAFTAAMPDGTGVSKIQKEFPDRAFDVGIAESACTDIAAGLAKTGLRPVAAIYSTFLQRAFDQTFQEVSLQNLPVTFCLDRAGLVGGDGAVHHGFCDVTMLRCLPNFVLMAPMDEEELNQSLEFSISLDSPAAIRYPRDKVPESLPLPEGYQSQPFELGKAVTLREGTDAVIVSYGILTQQALLAAENLGKQGYSIAVVNARFAKPIDEALIEKLLSEEDHRPVLTLEDHGLIGGFGSAVLEFAQQKKLDTRKIVRLGMPDEFIAQNSRNGQLAQVGIDQAGIEKQLREILAESKSNPRINQTHTKSFVANKSAV